MTSGSLPVATIATRDRVEEILHARQRADAHRLAMGDIDDVSAEIAASLREVDAD